MRWSLRPGRSRDSKEDGGDEPRAPRRLAWNTAAGKLMPLISGPPPRVDPGSTPPPEEHPTTPLPPPPKHTSYLRVGAERTKHIQTIIAAVIGIAVTLASAATPLVLWVTSRVSDKVVAKLREDFDEEKAVRLSAENDLRNTLRAEMDAGAQEQGGWWDLQDGINRGVAEHFNRTRKATPPPAVGPKAKARGRQ